MDTDFERDASPVFSGVVCDNHGATTPAMWNLPDEVPLSILYNGNSFAVMMVTPHDIEDFVIGFSITEGIADKAEDLVDIRVVESGDGYLVNVSVEAKLLDRAEGRRRTLTGRSGCGLCGAQSLDAVMRPLRKVSGFIPTATVVLKAFAALKANQPMNMINKSTHAAAFCSIDGDVLLVREDIGRHNALDKLAGAMALKSLSGSDGFLILSSRFSVEMVQKSVAIGVGFAASISAPSALGLRMADRAGLQLACLSGENLMVFDKVKSL